MHDCVLVSTRHVGAFGSFRHVRKEIITRKRPIQKGRQTAVRLKRQNVIRAVVIAIRSPDLFEVGTNVGNKRIASFELFDFTSARQRGCNADSAAIWKHRFCRDVFLERGFV